MIETYSTDITVASGSIIPFNLLANSKGCSVKKLSTTMFRLNAPGIYKIDCSASVVGSAAGEIEIGLTKNGSVLPQTLASVTAANTTSVYNLSFSTCVIVPNACCCSDDVIISVINNGVGSVFNNIDLLVTKL